MYYGGVCIQCMYYMRKLKETDKTKKMRLDALIIFLIEWPCQVLYLKGKQSKYWSQKNHEKTKKMRLDELIIFFSSAHTKCFFEG